MFNKACASVCIYEKGAKAKESMDRMYVDFKKRWYSATQKACVPGQ